MRKLFIACWLLALTVTVSWLFWQNEWMHHLPTPIPAGYKEVATGSVIDINANLPRVAGKPLFLHFFNPDCTCSRSNIAHFKVLAARYGSSLSFAVVVIDKCNRYTVKEVTDRFNLTMPVVFDNSLATACGVYSTPQAVILDAGNKLYYRGNYNQNCYSIDDKTSYARMAIDSLLLNIAQPAFTMAATRSYGCLLPVCTK